MRQLSKTKTLSEIANHLILMVGSSMIPSVPIYEDDHFSISLAPVLSLGTEGMGLGYSLDGWVKMGDSFKLSGGISHMFNTGTNDLSGLWNNNGREGRYSVRGSFEGYMVGATQFTGRYQQRLGLIGFDSDRYSLFHENDVGFIGGDDNDRWRTAAIYGSVKIDRNTSISFGTYLLTGEAKGDLIPGRSRETYKSEDAKIRSGILFGGIQYKGNSLDFGQNSEAVRAWVQNNWHDLMGPIPLLKKAPHFEVMNYDPKGYFRYRVGTQFSIY